MAKKQAEAKKEVKQEASSKKEMTAAEAKAWRASLAKPAAPAALSEPQAREAWRVYWAQHKSKWANSATNGLEQFIWLHLRSTKMNKPSEFEAGIKHFGLKKNS